MYAYRCDTCATTSPPARTRWDAQRHRDDHRRRVHGGHIPDGERLLRESYGRPGDDKIALVSLAVVALIVVLYHLL